MTNTELIDILKTLSTAETNPIGVYSVRAKLGTKVPYLVVLYGSSDNLSADDKTFYKEQAITIELYTKGKDEIIEALVEAKLDSAGLPWDKDEVYDDEQQIYINYYYITRR